MECKFVSVNGYICNGLHFLDMIERKQYISLLEKWKDKKVIKIVTGIRRCGKSSLLKMFCDKLQQDGVRKEQIQSVNFEDLDNEPLLDYKRLHSHIKERLLPDRMNYLFFDEIQLVGNFQKTIDSLFLLDNVDIYITGSNAYLLSGEIATLLTGRYVEIKLFPFSFSEFIMASGKPQSLEQAYRQ